jgi:hypothetical protein
MAKEIHFAKLTDTPELFPSWNMPELAHVVNAKAGDAVTRHGGGIEVANVTRTFRMLDKDGVNGPCEVTVSLAITRTALTENEQARIDKAKADQKTNAAKRKADDAEARQTAILEASERNVGAYRQGVADASKTAPNVADKVRESLALVDALRGIIAAPAALPAGESK